MGFFDVLGLLLFGLVVGAIARLLVPGRQPMGWLMTMVLGVLGSFAGGFLGSLFVEGEFDRIHPAGWVMSILGAIILVAIYAAASGRRRHI